MRKSWAEYKREARQRQREERRNQLDAAQSDLRTPFFEFFENYTGSNLNLYADILGERWWEYIDDSGIKTASDDTLTPEDLIAAGNSLGKAHLVIGCLIDAAADLAHSVGDYKRAEIDARISEIEQSDFSDPDAKEKAFADMARLKKMRDQLDKQVRWTFPQWKVTGE